MKNIKGFLISDTLNNKVNFEKLHIEMRTSTISKYARVFALGDEIMIEFNEEITEQEKNTLITVLGNHDGEENSTSISLIEYRRKKFNEMVQMAIYHPLLDDVESNKYLTHIDNYKNSFITDGIKNNIIAKITADAQAGEHTAFLNVVVNPAGNKTFEYLINEIQNI